MRGLVTNMKRQVVCVRVHTCVSWGGVPVRNSQFGYTVCGLHFHQCLGGFVVSCGLHFTSSWK